MKFRLPRRTWVLFPALLGGACDDSQKPGAEAPLAAPPPVVGASPASTDGECPDVPTAIFAAEGKCGGVVCHGTASKAPAIYTDFGHSMTDLEKRIMNAPGTGPCADYKIIDTANVENSLLILKLGPTPPCGAPMPFAQQGQISDFERQCIERWVRSKVGGS